MGRKRIHIRPERLGISMFLAVCWWYIFDFFVKGNLRMFCYRYVNNVCAMEGNIIDYITWGSYSAFATLGILFGIIGLYYWCQWVFVKCNGG